MRHDVAAGVLVSAPGVPMTRRRADQAHAPGTWSFAGGHVEPGETALDAVVRELREELGVSAVVDGALHLRVVERAGDPDELVMSIWIVHRWTGTPVNAAPDEHDELRWVRATDLGGLLLAHEFCRAVVEEFAPG